MFPSNKAGVGARSLGLAAGLAGTLLVAAPGAFAQSATDIIRELAPIEGQRAPAPPAPRPDVAPGPAPGFAPGPGFDPGPDPGPGPGPAFGPGPGPGPGFGPGAEYVPPPGPPASYGPRVEDTEVYIDGRHTRAYVDYARAIDLTVYFDYNSARVTERAREMLDRLGEALASPELQRYRFLIAGHTDAVGADEFNLDLSYRRALAVRDYLSRVHGIPRYRIAVKGWGRSRLKDPANPQSGINRRVEVALIVDRGMSYLENEQGYANSQFHGRRPWYTCPPGSRLIDPLRPDLNIDDFAAGAPNPMCRPIE